jgi:hypothetical protein
MIDQLETVLLEALGQVTVDVDAREISVYNEQGRQ